MPLNEDIAEDLESEPSSASPASTTPAAARRLRGHQPKIAEAVAALRAQGRLRGPNTRPTVRDKLILDWLDANGYHNDLPSPRAIGRYFEDTPAPPR
jgi:hypothetical protein